MPKKKVERVKVDNKKLLKEYLIEGNREAYNKLIEGNYQLADYFVRKYIIHTNDYKEFMSIAMDGMIKAIEKFDVTKIDSVSFSTFAGIHIKDKIIKELHARKKYKNNVYFSELEEEGIFLEDELVDDEDYVDNLINELNKPYEQKQLREVLNSLNDGDREAIEYVYGFKTGKPMTFEEVSKIMGVSRSMIFLRVNRALESFRKHMNIESKNEAKKSGVKLIEEDRTKKFYGEIFKNQDKRKVLNLLKVHSYYGLVFMYYGLGGKKCMSYEEIAENKKLPVSVVEETIDKIINSMKVDFKFEELRDSGFSDEFYDMFKGFNKSEVDACIRHFNKKYQCILHSYYGLNKEAMKDLAKEYNINVSDFFYKINELKTKIRVMLRERRSANKEIENKKRL